MIAFSSVPAGREKIVTALPNTSHVEGAWDKFSENLCFFFLYQN